MDSFHFPEGYKFGCYREILKSIANSSYSVIKQTINRIGLEEYFHFTKSGILNKQSGVEFIFDGLKSNPDSVKSTERLVRAWVEEADRTSQESIDMLIPTVQRVQGGKIIYSMNPKRTTDPLYKRFFGGSQPPNSLVQKITYKDNPFLTEQAKALIADMKENDYEKYLYIYEGEPLGDSDFVLFAINDIYNAMQRDLIEDKELNIGGFDVGHGGDNSALVIRNGKNVKKVVEYTEKDSRKLETLIYRDCKENNVQHLIVDADGLGLSFFDYLNPSLSRIGIMVHAFRGNSQVENKWPNIGKLQPKYFGNLRAYCHYKLKVEVESDLVLPDSQPLLDDMSAVKYKPDSVNGKFYIGDKKTFSHSPNTSDALMMTFMPLNIAKKIVDIDYNYGLKEIIF